MDDIDTRGDELAGDSDDPALGDDAAEAAGHDQGVVQDEHAVEVAEQEVASDCIHGDIELVSRRTTVSEKKICCKKCCCLPHCLVQNHNTHVWKKASIFTNPFTISTMMTNEVATSNSPADSDIVSPSQSTADSITDLLPSVDRNFMDK